MKAFELLTINQGILQMMKDASLDISDVKYLPMYREYMRMMQEGHKKTYIVQYLSDEYDISCRNAYRVIEKFSSDVDMS